MKRSFETFRSALVLACGLLLALAPGASAQSGRRPQPNGSATSGQSSADPKSDDGELKIGTSEVLVSVSVRDPEGRPVANLTQEDFILAENRTRQKIVSFSTHRVPINVLLILDASGSVFSERQSIRDAASRFAEKLGPEDRVSVIQFADTVELLQDWTNSHDDVKLALNWKYRGGQATDLWDALYVAASDQLSKVDGRRAIILLTDGVDTSSKVTLEQAKGALDRADTSVYVVSKAQALIDRAAPYRGLGGKIIGTAAQAAVYIDQLTAAEERLRGLTDRYGGRLYSPRKDAELASAYEQVADELGQQYVLSYVSTDERRDGAWRTIDVFLARPGLTARTRKGYVAE